MYILELNDTGEIIKLPTWDIVDQWLKDNPTVMCLMHKEG